MSKAIFPFGSDKRPEQRRRQRGSQANRSISSTPANWPAGPSDSSEPSTEPVETQPLFTESESNLYNDAQRWAAIIIDEPILDFEPKPPISGSPRPDTIFDGWSTDHLTVRMASVRGYSHRYRGIPRQDDAEVAFHPAANTVLFAVADGVSSASESHLGATSACRRAIDVMWWQLGKSGAIDLARVVQLTAEDLNSYAAHLLRQDQPTQAAVESLLATTLVAGYITPAPRGGTGAMIQIGDSSAWILQGNRYYPILEQKNDPDAQVISSAVSPLPRIPEVLTPVEFRLPLGAALLIATDGFGDPLGDGEGKVGHLFAENLRTPPPGRGLAHLLDFSRDTFDDDRTLVVVWQKPDAPEGMR